ncbi:hypothetical protein KAR91_82090, partial [Candidatus Pacearchaeota archaeon]|nr:hypothetical protein [Candidatus Pacearchaeota archaeon]
LDITQGALAMSVNILAPTIDGPVQVTYPVTIGPGGIRTKAITSKYPVEEGLILGTTKIEGREIELVPEVGSTVTDDREGI